MKHFIPILFHINLSFFKIYNIVLDKDDIGLSLNAIYPKFNSLYEMKFCIDYGKMKYIKDVEYGKGGILKSLGLIDIPDNKLKNIIFNEILTNYIYNLTYDSKYNVFKFNVCILLKTINNNYRKTVIALKYIPEIKEIHLITIT